MSSASSLRLALAGMLIGFGLCASPVLAAPAEPSLVPPGFFDTTTYTGSSNATIEADRLFYDAVRDVVTAEGDVIMTYEGHVMRTGSMVFNRRTGALTTQGAVSIVDPSGTRYVAEDLEVTGGFKEAFMRSLVLYTKDGALITATQADYSSEVQTILQDGTYSPCGECIDSKGRRIGWKMRSGRMIYDREDASLVMEQPVLEVLGLPVLWLPWVRIPDPSQPRATGFRLPAFDHSTQMGESITYPYFWALGENTDLIISPRLMTRQGALLALDLTHRFGFGEINARAAGLYQLDRSAFVGTVGDRDWRGAAQLSGRFTPVEQWEAGFSYTTFTDAAFLPDYKLTSGTSAINEVYVTHLSPDYYANLRLQEFNLLGNVTPLQQQRHAKALPNVRANSVTDLPDNWGQIRTAMRVLGVQRGADHTATHGGVPYVFAYKENKVHATVEASWQRQFLTPGGIAITPFLGLRGDAAYYDGSSPLLAGPTSLLTATPIAAVDVRWPFIADDGISNYLFEPIAQLVYRGSGTNAPGITNDNAVSFAFDDTNLFTYDRFSGTDRQETGLRANVGAHYLANFADSSWIDLAAGQSYFLGGLNALSIADTALVGASTGLGGPASHFVVGARAGFADTFAAGAKVRIDPATPRIASATLGANFSDGARLSAGVDYTYIAADPVVGTTTDQHEITGRVGVPIDDYWTATATASWDLSAGTWLEAGAGLLYDDGYFDIGGGVLFTGPTHSTPNDLRASATMHIKAPGGKFGLDR